MHPSLVTYILCPASPPCIVTTEGARCTPVSWPTTTLRILPPPPHRVTTEGARCTPVSLPTYGNSTAPACTTCTVCWGGTWAGRALAVLPDLYCLGLPSAVAAVTAAEASPHFLREFIRDGRGRCRSFPAAARMGSRKVAGRNHLSHQRRGPASRPRKRDGRGSFSSMPATTQRMTRHTRGSHLSRQQQ